MGYSSKEEELMADPGMIRDRECEGLGGQGERRRVREMKKIDVFEIVNFKPTVT
jgi:hypothetical protein